MKKFLPAFIIFSLQVLPAKSQPCTPTGNETTYGTGNVWIGYVYDDINFTNYRGYVNEGTAASPDFDRNFGGSNVNYPTNGCTIQTETFSVRYKLTKTFASGNYTFTIGGDDGYRLSLDGGVTWAINRWVDQSYTISTLTIALNGTYNMVLEYYENGGDNRISFSVATACTGTEDTGIYGTGNIWNGYVYDGINFEAYVGMVHEGAAGSPDFDQSFGGGNVSYATSGCTIQTETFSVRYRLTRTFAPGTYMFTVGADDGYRFSVDGGATWVINNWALHSYTSTNYSLSLSGTYNLVVEYYENEVDNRISFAMQTLSLLPVTLQSFTAREKEHTVELNWEISSNSNPRLFEVEKSIDASTFSGIGTVPPNNSPVTEYSFTDPSSFRGTSYYRLKMTDMTGIITYSAIITIRTAPASSAKISIYPTIISGSSFFVTSNSNIRNAIITITGLNGKTISRQNAGNVTAGQAIRVNAAPAKGIYAVTISGGDFGIATGKIIIP